MFPYIVRFIMPEGGYCTVTYRTAREAMDAILLFERMPGHTTECHKAS